MVRAPCCEKVGLKKGPWSPEEDRVLVNFINLYGHDNWRALPKQAGLPRCGKSCRLRWTNYLRPDIKRGNFSREEEGTIIALHQQLGNRWSAIAAKLPGRTDNEIKNVWHTHLKKRVLKQPAAAELSANTSNSSSNSMQEENPGKMSSSSNEEASESPQQSSSDETSSSTNTKVDLPEDFPEMDEEFWSEVLSADTSGTAAEASAVAGDTTGLEFAFFDELLTMEPVGSDGMEFWYDMFTRAGEFPELVEF